MKQAQFFLPLIAMALAGASDVARTRRFNVPSQDAVDGLAAFSRQAATVQLLVTRDAVRGRRTGRLNGMYSIESALTVLLRGSGLRWRRTGPTTYSLITIIDKGVTL